MNPELSICLLEYLFYHIERFNALAYYINLASCGKSRAISAVWKNLGDKDA